MARKKLNREATKDAIVSKAYNTRGMTIDINKFQNTTQSVADLKKYCKFVGIDPVYQDAANSITIPEFKAPKLSNCRSPFQPFS